MTVFDKLLTMSEEEQTKVWNNHCADVRGDGFCTQMNCSKCNLKWLVSEWVEPKHYTANEVALAKLIDDEYKWIVRDETGALCVHAIKPEKSGTRRFWEVANISGACSELKAFEKMFQSVKWEDAEPTSLDEIRNYKE